MRNDLCAYRAAMTQLLTARQVAELCQRDYRAVLRAIRAGELEASDLTAPGSRRPEYRVRPEALEAWLNARKVRPNSPAQQRNLSVVSANAHYRELA